MHSSLVNALSIALMIFGFGFVVFFHEMGHFLAAKWVGIKVEQFAVGFGQALFAWRKGLGWRIGTTTPEYKKRIEEHLAAKEKSTEKGTSSQDKPEYSDQQMREAAEELGLGDTEYRLNWIPLGGYVKMLGQDDMKPGQDVSDPRAYTRKSVPQRMLVVSAGVIMNIILAAIGFMIVFLIGFNVPPPLVGSVLDGSPAQKAGLHPGDRILEINGSAQGDFTKVGLGAALLPEGVDVTLVYEPAGQPGVRKTTHIRGDRREGGSKGFLSIGVGAAVQLTGLDPATISDKEFDELTDKATSMADRRVIRPGDTIIAVQGQPVQRTEFYKLDAALQSSDGRSVDVTVRSKDGKERTEKISPHFDRPFSTTMPLAFAGIRTLPMANGIVSKNIEGKIKPGDVIYSITLSDLKQFPTDSDLIDVANRAHEDGKKLKIQVLRDGNTQPQTIDDIAAAFRVERGRYGLGIGLGYAENVLIVSAVTDNSAAKKAGVPKGARITQVDGQPVTNWFQVRTLLSKATGEHKIVAEVPQVKDPQTYTLNISAADVADLSNMVVVHEALLQELREPRKTSNPLTAASWGVTETRDFVLQFYVTIKRMLQGSVGASNMMGPVGIVGAAEKIATKGMDWLIWFLAMISANLAVVNFLPIPIVDGGLFTFLIIEKIQGKPLSQRTQIAAQYVGFALIISVFLFVTYQDIARLILG